MNPMQDPIDSAIKDANLYVDWACSSSAKPAVIQDTIAWTM
jgi:hypothetical protein